MGVFPLLRVLDLPNSYFALKVFGILKPFLQKGFERVKSSALVLWWSKGSALALSLLLVV